MKKNYFLLLAVLLISFNTVLFAQSNGTKDAYILIMNWDGNGSSLDGITVALDELGAIYDVETGNIPADLSSYEGIFVLLGIFSAYHVVSDSEGQTLADYLDTGGSLYMEGGDTWAYNAPTAVHAYFNIDPIADGSGDMSLVNGQSSTFTQGMSFNYSGENNYMDHISPLGSAFLILENDNPNYGTAVAYDGGSYKTIGTGHEFAGLDDGASPSTKLELMTAYCDFLEIPLEVEALIELENTNPCANTDVQYTDASHGQITSWTWTFEGGTPASSDEQHPIITYANAGLYDVSLIVSDGVEDDTIVMMDLIEVSDVPAVPNVPSGLALLCDVLNSTYSVPEVALADTYEWITIPEEAGIITENDNNITIQWDENFYGMAQVKVASINFCGTSEFSIPIIVQRYPNQAILDFENPQINNDDEPFLLNEGIPAGGEYAGESVYLEGGEYFFDPSVAGIGNFEITYTFSGPCGTSTITDTLFVIPVGIKSTEYANINIFPNPSNGQFTLKSKLGGQDVQLRVLNLVGQTVYQEELSLKNNQMLDLSKIGAGVYFIQVMNKDIRFVERLIIK